MKSTNDPMPVAAVVDEVKGADTPAVVVSVSNIDQEVETWFGDLLQSIPVLRETEVFNRMRPAVDDLKKRIQ